MKFVDGGLWVVVKYQKKRFRKMAETAAMQKAGCELGGFKGKFFRVGRASSVSVLFRP